MKTFFMSLLLATLAFSPPSYSQQCYEPGNSLQILNQMHMKQTWSGISDNGYTISIYTDKDGNWLIFTDMSVNDKHAMCLIDHGKKDSGT